MLLILCILLSAASTISEQDLFDSHVFWLEDPKASDWLDNVCSQKVVRNHYRVHGVDTCSGCFRAVSGISKSSMTRAHKAMCSGQHLRSTPSPRGRPSRIKRIDLEAWLNLLATEVGDWMPHETVVELPHYTKQEIFRTYLGDWEKFGDEPASQTTFYRTFTDQGKRVRLRLRRTFKKCSVCHDFDVRIKMTKDPEERQNLRDAKSKHLKDQRDERCVYSDHKAKARNKPNWYLSIIIDDMDQNKTSVPQTDRETDATQEAPRVRVHVTGVRVHGEPNLTHVFTWFDHFPSDCNVPIECLLRILETVRQHRGGQLPPVLYLQLDNCGVNKNRWLLALLALLVEKGIFQKIKLSFLMVGHTHADIDQFFSCVSRKLKHLDTVHTLPQLHAAIVGCMDKVKPVVEHLYDICDYKSWIDTFRGNLAGHSMPRVFRFKKCMAGQVLMHHKPNMTQRKVDDPDVYEPQAGIQMLKRQVRIPLRLPLVPHKPLPVTGIQKSKETVVYFQFW